MSYKGDRIEPNEVIERVKTLALEQGFTITEILPHTDGDILWLTRQSTLESAPSVLLSTGIHGDEPAGPLAIAQILGSGKLDKSINWRISPLLNPAGFRRNQRNNASGIDLNRDFKKPVSLEAKALINCYQSIQENFDLALLLHEDWESDGFYLYDLQPDPEWGREIIRNVATVCPIDTSDEIDGMPAQGGVIASSLRSRETDSKLGGDWPEAFYLKNIQKAKIQYTLEAPSSLSMETRVNALAKAIFAASERIRIS